MIRPSLKRGKYRILQIDEDEFIVQRRWLWMWFNAAFTYTYAGDFPLHFKTLEKAEAWLLDVQQEKAEQERRAAFRPMIVWP